MASKALNIRVDDALLARIEAARGERTVTEYARRAIERACEGFEGRSAAPPRMTTAAERRPREVNPEAVGRKEFADDRCQHPKARLENLGYGIKCKDCGNLVKR